MRIRRQRSVWHVTPGLVVTVSLVVSLIRSDDNDDDDDNGSCPTWPLSFPCCEHHLCWMEAPSLRGAGKVPRRLTSWSQWSVPPAPEASQKPRGTSQATWQMTKCPALWGLQLGQPAVLSQLCSAWGISVKGRTPNGLLCLLILPQNDQPKRAVAFKGRGLICKMGIKLRPIAEK